MGFIEIIEKRHKSSEIDMVTVEMIQASGQEWIEAFYQVCRKLWELSLVLDMR